jgi:hypothetical protein
MLKQTTPSPSANDVQRSTGPAAGPAPGKTTLTAGIQLKAAGAGQAQDPGAVQEAAAAGISGAGGQLPYLDRIQASFGRHDVSGISAHQDGAATEAAGAMGAQAYATGSHVAFAGSPDLHTAAHEAAHVVQQKGGVQLAGGVGQAGDRYEQHADAVADAVVAGQSAEGLLDQMAGGGGGGGSAGAVQHLREDENAPDPDGECRELTQQEVINLLAKVATGQTIRPSEQRNLRVALEATNNQTFAAYLRALDSMGLLQAVMRKLYGHAATPGGGANQREFPVVCYRFWNAADQIDADVATANTIYGHHGIMITAVSRRVISKADTERVVGHGVDDEFKLDRRYSEEGGKKRFGHADMAAVVREYVPKTVVGGLWAKRIVTESGGDLAGTSSRAGSFGDYHRLAAVATDHSGADTFAHELGHILANEGHTDTGLMETGSTRDKTRTGADLLTADELTTIRSSALGWARQAP